MKYMIQGLDAASMDASKRHWDGIAKPLGSLGHLEEAIIRIAGIKRTADVKIDKKCVVVLCSDNGVVAEGVTQTGSEVTSQVARSVASGTASVNAMARTAGADVICVDVGMLADVMHPNLLRRKTANGTGNISRGAAMTTAQAEAAIHRGVQLVLDLTKSGYDIIATGEMGIGNTTTSSAIACALLGEDVHRMTGRGAGLSSVGLQRKISAIVRALSVNRVDKTDPIDVLSKLGGYDIATMVGIFIGGAMSACPVVIDGFISSVAALVAAKIEPNALAYMFASHVSREPAGQLVLDALNLTPIIYANMALGEGTGAVALFPLLEMALAVYRQNSTFEEIKVETYKPLN